MVRFCCACCLSRKKRKSFPINDKQRESKDSKETKVFIKHVENIRVSPPPLIPKPTTTIRKKINETKTNSCAIEQEKKSIDSRKSKQQQRTPSPVLKTISDIPEEDHVKTRDSSTSSSSSSSSSTSTSTNTEQRKMKKNKRKKSKHRSSTHSYDISKEYPASKRSVLPPKTKITDKKSTAKSKLVLENVRKMMKDQNIQDQHFNKTQQKESARL